jgi:hypothetical protein
MVSITMTADQILELALQIIGATTLLLQILPTLDKKNRFKPILQFLGKYVALNKPVIRDRIDSWVLKKR